MSSLLILRVLLFVSECVLASVALPLLAFAVTALPRRRAALRHLVWTTMFGVLAVLPVAALLLPPREIVRHAAAPAADLAAPAVLPAIAVSAPAMAAPPPVDLLTPDNIVGLLVALWFAGLAWQGLRFLVGTFGLVRLRHAGAPFMTAIETGCEVLLSRGEDGPSTFGVLRPVVLLPRSAQGWSAARLEAVLRHEAAHVARRDTLSQCVARLVCALYWPNPLLWLARRALRRAAEIAADDAVLASGMTPSLYAAELVRLAAESNGIAPGIAMAQPPLVDRVQSVLAENSSRKGVSRMDIAKTVCLGLAATLLLGAARFDLAVAQDVPVAPVAPAAPAALALPAPEAARIQAQADRVKARADAVTQKARARAEAETDPAKKEQYRKEAELVAADAAKATADAAQYAIEARKHMALAFQLADEVRQQAQQRAAADRMKMQEAQQQMAEMRQRLEADRQRMRLAEATPPSGGHADASADSSVTIDGVTATGHVRLESKPGEPTRITADNMRTQNIGPDMSRLGTVQRYTNTRDGVKIDIQVAPAVNEAMNRPEMRAAINQAVTSAMMEASRKIDAAMAAAKAKAGLSPSQGGGDLTTFDVVAPDGPLPPRSVPVPPVPPVLPR